MDTIHISALGLVVFGVYVIIAGTQRIACEVVRIKEDLYWSLFRSELPYCIQNGKRLPILDSEYQWWLKITSLNGVYLEDVLKYNMKVYWEKFDIAPPAKHNPPRQPEGTLATDCNSLIDVIPPTRDLRGK